PDSPLDLADVCAGRLKACLLGNHASNGYGGIGSQQPEADVPLGLCGGPGPGTLPRPRAAFPKEGERLLRLKELSEPGPLAAICQRRIRVRKASELLSPRDLRLGSNC